MQLTISQKRELNNLMNKGYSYEIAYKEIVGKTVSVIEKVVRKFVEGKQNSHSYHYGKDRNY